MTTTKIIRALYMHVCLCVYICASVCAWPIRACEHVCIDIWLLTCLDRRVLNHVFLAFVFFTTVPICWNNSSDLSCVTSTSSPVSDVLLIYVTPTSLCVVVYVEFYRGF